jgi:O-antigen/teichoic acid export membrane protein
VQIWRHSQGIEPPVCIAVGIIRRQSIQSSILFYIGAAIGFLSKILIFPNFLTPEEVGLSNILVTNAMLYAVFAAMGFSTMTLRFFPYFQDRTRRHHDFLTVLMIVPGIGFLLVTALVVIFQKPLMGYFEAKSPLMVEYFWYLIPLAFATLYFDLLDAYLRSLLKTVVPIFFREVVQRLLVVLSILLYAFGWLDFPQFVMVYVALLSSVTVLMLIYIAWLGHLHWRPRWSWRMRQLFRRILIFGGYTLLGNISVNVLYTIDGLMLAAYIGMDAVGIYTTNFYLSALILIPWRAIQKVAAPQVAEHWKSGDMVAMDKLYKRTSLINMGIGCFLYMTMIIGMDALFAFMPQVYREGSVVLIIIGATRLFDMITGLNGYIMVTSKYYRMDLVFNLLLVMLAILLNAILIPRYGILGAAVATAIALAVSNLFRLGFLWWTLKLQPLTREMLFLALITAVAFLGQWAVHTQLPLLTNLLNLKLHPIPMALFSFGLRFVIFTLFFALPLIYFRLIPDVNKLFELVLSKIGFGKRAD